MSKGTTFEVIGDHTAAFQFALDNLQVQGFTITARSEHFKAQVERGSKSGTIWVGVMTGDKYHLRMNVQGHAHGANLVIHLLPSTTGASAGFHGVRRARQLYREVAENLGNALFSTGNLVSSSLTTSADRRRAKM